MNGKPDYSLLPAHCQGGMRRYIEEGIAPGDFMLAVLSNDLVGAASRADNTNINRLKDYALFLYNEVPSTCWGSREKVDAWMQMMRAKKLGETITNPEPAAGHNSPAVASCCGKHS